MTAPGGRCPLSKGCDSNATETNDICAITEHKTKLSKGYIVTIYIREADDWKIRMAYLN
jgi:hypothetical protein